MRCVLEADDGDNVRGDGWRARQVLRLTVGRRVGRMIANLRERADRWRVRALRAVAADMRAAHRSGVTGTSRFADDLRHGKSREQQRREKGDETPRHVALV